MFECPECGYESESKRGLRIHDGMQHDGSLGEITVQCSFEDCDKEEQIPDWYDELYDDWFCSQQHRNEYLSSELIGRDITWGDKISSGLEGVLEGENHPNWKEDTVVQYGHTWKKIRKKALDRDNYECQECSISQSELDRSLDVHHITSSSEFDDPKESHKLENLISLCRACHMRVESSQEKILEVAV